MDIVHSCFRSVRLLFTHLPSNKIYVVQNTVLVSGDTPVHMMDVACDFLRSTVSHPPQNVRLDVINQWGPTKLQSVPTTPSSWAWSPEFSISKCRHTFKSPTSSSTDLSLQTCLHPIYCLHQTILFGAYKSKRTLSLEKCKGFKT